MKKITFMLFAFLSTLIGFAQTETLTGWSFPTDDGTPLVIEAECGSGNLYADGTNGSSDWTGGVDFFGGHTPAEANQVCGSTTNTQAYSLLNGASGANNGKHLVFKFSTADYEDIVLTYSTRGTANGFDTHTWAYSTDGVAFTDVSTITGTNNTTFSTQTVDFSSNTAINNQSDVYIRLTLSGAGTQNSQNNRLDNIKFVGTEVEAGPPSVGCEIAVTISWEEYADVTNWRLLDVNGDVAIQGGGDWDDEFYDYDSSSTKTHIVANPPYSLEITIDDWMEYCDNNIDYSVTVGGVQDISGTVFVVCDDVITQTFTIGDCPDCSAPANLSASDLTFTSAELSWTGDASLFDIEWGLEGFTQGSGTEVNNISANTHPLTGLTAETSYDFYVRQNCGIDGLSTWAGPYTFYTGYCEVSTTNTTDYISEFSTSGATQNVTYTATSQPAGSYANETAQVIQQAQGLPINFTSTFVGGPNGIKIWVDVNNDFIFDEATEVVFYEASASLTKNGVVTVPINLPVGDYRVRVRGQYGSSANPLACGNISWGSTIDFTLQVTAAPSCLPPSDLSATTTSNSATLSWISTGTLFDIEYGATGFTQGTGTPINEVTNPYTLNGLNIGSYDYYVRQNCGNGDESIWIGPYNFTVGAYQAGDIPTQSGTSAGITVNSTDYCTPEPTLTIDVPAGMQIASLQVQYSMTAHNGAWMSEQRSFIYSPTLNTGEATMTSGTGTAGTLEYNRSVDFANGATGSVDFVLRAWRTWSTFGEEGCSVYNNYVNNGTWVIIPTFEPFVDPCADITAPVGDAIQTLDLGDTLADLDVTGTDLTWYSDATLTTEVAETFVFDQVGEFTYYVTQTVGDCTSDALAITVTVVDPCDNLVVPVFSPVNPICQGGFLLALPTTSTNGITGTWSPALNNMETTTYEFTPNPGECATTASLTIIVIPNVVPIFNSIPDICEGDFLEELPAVSMNGITGTWLPALDNTQTTTYIFIPSEGQCASTVSMTIIVNETPDAPIADSPQSITTEQTIADILVDGDNLTWYSDSDLTTVVDETFVLTEGSYTFWVTQTVGDCTSEATEIQVEVTLSTNTFDNASFRAYPNPVKDFFTISYNKEITNISVVNILGQTVMEKAVNTTDTQIDMTSLPTGNYFVKVTTEGAVKTVKVIKQ